MTPTLPRPPARRRRLRPGGGAAVLPVAPLRPHETSREALERHDIATSRAADVLRIAVVCGVMLLGSFPPDTPLDDILDALRAALADPASFASLDWPRCLSPQWRWEAGREDLALWHAGRLLAVASRGPDGALLVRRFDRPGAP